MTQLNDFAKVKILIYHYSLALAVDILNRGSNDSRDWTNFLAKAASEVCEALSPEEINERVEKILKDPKPCCTECGGSGTIYFDDPEFGEDWIHCQVCDGSGKLVA